MAQTTTEDILTLFWATSKRLRQKLSYGGAVAKLTIQQLETLKTVEEHKRILMKDVAVGQAITPPSATVMVGHLAKLKLLARKPDPKDRRGVYLALTKKGEAVFKKAARQQRQEMNKLLRRLSQTEKNQFASILKKMSTN